MANKKIEFVEVPQEAINHGLDDGVGEIASRINDRLNHELERRLLAALRPIVEVFEEAELVETDQRSKTETVRLRSGSLEKIKRTRDVIVKKLSN